MRNRTAVSLVVAVALSASGSAWSAVRTYTLATDPAVLNLWPGPDGLIDTADDLEDGNPSPVQNSAPNSVSAYSFNAFDFGGSDDPTRIPAGFNAMTFLTGTVTYDDVSPLADFNFDVDGTEPFIGHGPYSNEILALNSSAYDPNTKVWSANFDLQVNLLGGAAIGSDIDMTGEAYIIDAADFGSASGNAYIDNVVIPLAQDQNATSLLFITGDALIPQSDPGPAFFPSFDIRTVFVALELPEPSAAMSSVAALVMLVALRRCSRRDA